MLAKGLRVFEFCPRAIAILADGGFERDTPIGIDGVSRPAKQRLRQAAVRSKVAGLGAFSRNHFAGVATDKKPFTGLPFELNHVQSKFVGSRIARAEVRCFAFDCHPARRDRNVASGHQHLRIEPADVNLNAGRSEAGDGVERRQVIQTLIERQRVFDSPGVIPSHAALRPARKRDAGIMKAYAWR